MPKLIGVFDTFKNLDQIPVSNISRWTKHKSNLEGISNFLGNRLLYPQTVSMNKLEIEIDLAILREAISNHPEVVYSSSSSKIIIPEKFLHLFPPPTSLMIILIQSLKLPKITSIFLNDLAGNTLEGSIYAPLKLPAQDTVDITINGQKSQLKLGTIAVFPILEHTLEVVIDDTEKVLLNGGKLGLAIDLRKKING